MNPKTIKNPKGAGRPPMYTEKQVYMTIRVPKSLIPKIVEYVNNLKTQMLIPYEKTI